MIICIESKILTDNLNTQIRNCARCCGYRFFSVTASHPIDGCTQAAEEKIFVVVAVVAHKSRAFANQIDAFNGNLHFSPFFCVCLFHPFSFSRLTALYLSLSLYLSFFLYLSLLLCFTHSLCCIKYSLSTGLCLTKPNPNNIPGKYYSAFAPNLSFSIYEFYSNNMYYFQ